MRARLIALAVIASLFGACEGATTPSPLPQPTTIDSQRSRDVAGISATNLDAVVWMQRSATYDGACHQTFAAALQLVDRGLADPTWSALPDPPTHHEGLPPAVIVNVDETVLDNSPYQARLAVAGAEHSPAAWAAWVEERAAASVPGALEFSKAATERGVTIFYVTNRHSEHRDLTRDNLASAGFPLRSDIEVVLTREGDDKDKEARRRAVARSHRILLLIGDQLGDFVSTPDDEFGRAFASRNAARFGREWLVVPNPSYGEWRAKEPAQRMTQLRP